MHITNRVFHLWQSFIHWAATSTVLFSGNFFYLNPTLREDACHPFTSPCVFIPYVVEHGQVSPTGPRDYRNGLHFTHQLSGHVWNRSYFLSPFLWSAAWRWHPQQRSTQFVSPTGTASSQSPSTVDCCTCHHTVQGWRVEIYCHVDVLCPSAGDTCDSCQPH